MIFLVIFLAAMIHASFHLSISVLTLLSGHTISREKSHLKLIKLSFSLVFGAVFATILLFSAFAYFAEIFYKLAFSKVVWAVLVGIMVSSAVSVWAFYYRINSKSTSGTELWIPRGMAQYLSRRAKKTKHSAEAFSLGITSVVSEVLFFFAPLMVSALFASTLPASAQFLALVIYVLVANFPLFSIFCMISGGHPISSIQIWREKNKHFLQFAAGLGLVVLAFLVGAIIFAPELVGL